MTGLPSGTVSLLFSDVEGSTLLLRRLGPDYATALDELRRLQRTAWVDHGGIELGTEGDSFYVVFRDAPEAVAAAVQAQKELADYPWPGGEHVRVRMGVHTGSPVTHADAYVGMDVHLAARIAAAAHGGQVLVSAATAELVSTRLPEGVALRDLGAHNLKDIAVATHLYQLAIGGLPVDFPPPKALGAASSLPRPATPLVGREREVAELTALLRTPDVRLVSLTGPGGSGKTRLAIAVAERMTAAFPDGVYFVDLAGATRGEVMWTTIGETLDVPPEGRIPPGLFEHVAHRTALLVLDNLEQVDGADAVVDDLLGHAAQIAVVATSRRPLAIGFEHVHPVPPLELPEHRVAAEGAARFGAVAMFVQEARRASPSFRLTADNVADVVEVCRRLDGLPLAVALAAARCRLLSPKAILARLDAALDIVDRSLRGPARQKTLRETISWSYDLLDDPHQTVFRTLGVFAGGADLDAISTVAAGALGDADPLDVAGELVDANLLRVTEDAAGEPRFSMLKTVRAYALDELHRAGEDGDARLRHAQHYAVVAEDIRLGLRYAGRAASVVVQRATLEHDNFREALAWALGEQGDRQPAGTPVSPEIAQRLASRLAIFWRLGGYVAEGTRWVGLAVAASGEHESSELARCLQDLGYLRGMAGDVDAAVELSTKATAMARRLGDQELVAGALITRAEWERTRGDVARARHALEEAADIARAIGDGRALAQALAVHADVEAQDGQGDRSLELSEGALQALGDSDNGLMRTLVAHNMAATLLEVGRAEEAEKIVRADLPAVIGWGMPGVTIETAEIYAPVLIELDRPRPAAVLVGAADAARERSSFPRHPLAQAELDQPITKGRGGLGESEWQAAYDEGTRMQVEDALRLASASAS